MSYNNIVSPLGDFIIQFLSSYISVTYKTQLEKYLSSPPKPRRVEIIVPKDLVVFYWPGGKEAEFHIPLADFLSYVMKVIESYGYVMEYKGNDYIEYVLR